MDRAQAFLFDQVPLHLRPKIPETLKNAYAAADLLIKGEPILQVTSARDGRGRIVQWAVDLGFQKLCESGEWPFDHRWKYFAKPTGRYLEIRPSHSVLTISQVSDPKKSGAKFAKYRKVIGHKKRTRLCKGICKFSECVWLR